MNLKDKLIPCFLHDDLKRGILLWSLLVCIFIVDSFGQNTVTIDHWNFKNSRLDSTYITTCNVFEQIKPCLAYRIATTFEGLDPDVKTDAISPKECYKPFENTYIIYSIPDSNNQLADSIYAALRGLWLIQMGDYKESNMHRLGLWPQGMLPMHCGFLNKDSIQIPILTLDDFKPWHLAFNGIFTIIEVINSNCGHNSEEFLFKVMSLSANGKEVTFGHIEQELFEVDVYLTDK